MRLIKMESVRTAILEDKRRRRGRNIGFRSDWNKIWGKIRSGEKRKETMRAESQRFSNQLRQQLSPVDKRERKLWILFFPMVGILLAGIFAITFPGAFLRLSTDYAQETPQLLLGLLALVLLFCLVLIHECNQIRTLRFNSILEAWRCGVADIQLFTDPLTQVFNRSALDGVLREAIQGAHHMKASLVFMYIDVNNFKQLNAFYGHLSGDLVLAEVGGLIHEWIRCSDYVIRLGGDEFLVALLNTNGSGGALVKQRIQQRVTEWNEVIASEENSPLPGFKLSLSIGIHELNGLQSLDQALEEASNNMDSERTQFQLRQMSPSDRSAGGFGRFLFESRKSSGSRKWVVKSAGKTLEKKVLLSA